MTALQDTIDRLAAFEPAGIPVVSLYLDMRPDEHGRDNFDGFVRKELRARVGSYEPHSVERESLEQDVAKIEAYLADEVRPSANGLALFACAAADLFEAIQLDAPLDRHRVYVGETPHLFHLARLSDQFPRFAAVVLDTHQARILVFELNERVDETTVEGKKPKSTRKGGWSQARYQRRTENIHLSHAREVADALDRVVREDAIERIVLAGDEVIIPALRDELPQHLADKIVDVLSLDVRAPEHEVLASTLERIREQDAKEDEDKVQRLMDAWRGGGLGVVGVRDTLEALVRGQVDELLVATAMELQRPAPGDLGPLLEISPDAAGDVDISDELVTRAAATGARVTFIEDASLLDGVGGVGGLLRFRL